MCKSKEWEILSNRTPVTGRRGIAELLEYPGKVLWSLKTARKCYINHTRLGRAQHPLRSFDPRAKNVLVRSTSRRPPKHLREVSRAQAGDRRQLHDVDVLIHLCMNIFNNSSQLSRCQAATAAGERSAQRTAYLDDCRGECLTDRVHIKPAGQKAPGLLRLRCRDQGSNTFVFQLRCAFDLDLAHACVFRNCPQIIICELQHQ